MEYRLLVLVVLVALAVVDVASAKKDKKKRSKKAMMGLEIEELKENLTKLWEKMDSMGPPVHVHMHGEGGMMEDHMHDGDGTHVHIHLGHEAQHHASHENLLEEDGYFHAQCNIHPGSGTSDSITGTVFFKQREGGPLKMKIALEGFDVSGPRPQHSHGFHLHEYGDLTQGCASLGGHFNPHGTTHGSMHGNHSSRHAGDWGNIQCNSAGVVEDYKMDRGTTLLGEHSIIGRGIVIHEGPDDMGMGGKPDSHKTGAAGGRLACCVITWHTMTEWEMGPVMEGMEKVEDHSSHHGHHRHVRDVHHFHDHAHHDHAHHDHAHHDHAHHDHAHHDHHDHAHHDHAHHPHHDHAGHPDHADHAGLHDHPDHPGHHEHEHQDHPSLSDFLHDDHLDHYLHGERHHHRERLPKDQLPL